MGETKLMIRRFGRTLFPLLGIYIILGAIAVIMRTNERTPLIYGLTTMLISVGITLYALDYPIRFFVLGEDRLLHISPTSRVKIAGLSSVILGIILFCFFIVNAITQVLLGDSSHSASTWIDSLLLGSISKLASLASSFSLVLFLSALVKLFRGRIFTRSLSWIGLCVITATFAGGFIWFLHESFHVTDWGIGIINKPVNTIYATLIPILIPKNHELGNLAWSLTGINLAVAALSIAGFIFLCKHVKMNFLEE